VKGSSWTNFDFFHSSTAWQAAHYVTFFTANWAACGSAWHFAQAVGAPAYFT
jgi:hypothetical protein